MPAFTFRYLAAFSLMAEENCLTSLNRSGTSSSTCRSKADVTLGSSVPWSRLSSSRSRSSARDTSTNSSAELCKHWSTTDVCSTHQHKLQCWTLQGLISPLMYAWDTGSNSGAELCKDWSVYWRTLETPAQTLVLNSARIDQSTDLCLRYQHKLQCWTLQAWIYPLISIQDTSTNSSTWDTLTATESVTEQRLLSTPHLGQGC